jgi:hypothetical protein
MSIFKHRYEELREELFDLYNELFFEHLCNNPQVDLAKWTKFQREIDPQGEGWGHVLNAVFNRPIISLTFDELQAMAADDAEHSATEYLNWLQEKNDE